MKKPALLFLLAGVTAGAIAGGAVAVWEPDGEEPAPAVECPPTAPATTQPLVEHPSATSTEPAVVAGERPTATTTIVIPEVTAGSGQTIPLTGPDAALAVLQSELAAAVANTSVPGRFAVSVTDLWTGATASVNGDRVQRSACVMNLFAIILVLRDVQEGFYPLETVDATIRQTIWASDATAARLLYRQAGNGDVVEGVRRVAALQHEVMGLNSTVIDHPPAFGDESIGVSDDNFTTANEMNKVLAMLYGGDLLRSDLRDYLLEAMTAVKPGLNYLTGSLPDDATVSHKNGFFPAWDGYVDNDTAIVRFGPSLEYAYAVTFLAEQIPTEYEEIWFAQGLIYKAWYFFEDRYLVDH
ncbi:MAG TPA: serine hydrolase [Tepidiformaceae bacterium]|nr:serine hydrolase [Tepidiformaceae bacterium]